MKKTNYPHYIRHNDGSLLIYVLYELPHLEYHMEFTELKEQNGVLEEGTLVYVYKISSGVLDIICQDEELYGLYNYIKKKITFEELPIDIQVLLRLN